jgi:tetratricopeptide (TPR) repeat protein
MRLYNMVGDRDLMDTITRSYQDAERGHVLLALDRLRALDDELGPNARIAYAEGMIRVEFLGQGKGSYDCFVRALEIDPRHVFAACNAAAYAPNEAEFRRRAEVAARLSPADAKGLRDNIEGLDEGRPYWDLITADPGNREPGVNAATAEIGLSAGRFKPDDEVQRRRQRAQWLRELDNKAARPRETAAEDFPPEERLALAEAIVEIDKALEIDDDAELWNLRSAWCYLMKRLDDAVESADRALALRPTGYLRPYQNKGLALVGLDRLDEARTCLRTALDIAKKAGGQQELDEPFVRRLIAETEDSRSFTLALARPVLAQGVKAALVSGNQYLGSVGTTSDQLAGALLGNFRGSGAVPGRVLTFVPALARALVDITAEACFAVLVRVEARDSGAYENAMKAVVFISACAEPVMQRDAQRLLALAILAPALDDGGESQVLELYRRSVLEVAAAADGPLERLDGLMRAELARIMPKLPEVIADQQPVDSEGRARGERLFISQMQGNVLPATGNEFGGSAVPGGDGQAGPGGCAGVLLLLLVASFVMAAKLAGLPL